MSTTILEVFDSNEAKKPELHTENKLVFIGLHVAGVKALRVETDGVRVSFVYLHSEAFAVSHIVMETLTNGACSEPYMVDLSRLIIAWNVWETYLNMMRDMSRRARSSQRFE